VLEIGNAVTDVRAGDRVVTFAAHRSHYRLPASEIAAVVPNNLGGADASITYLFQLALVSLRRAGIRAEHRVAVIGLGALGMASVAIGKLNGAKVTAISGRVPALNQALRLGAEQVLLKGSPAIQDVHADIVVTTSNDWSDWQLALQVAGRGGVIAVLGFPGRGQGAPSFNPLDSQYFYEKQLNEMATGQLLEPEYPTSSLAVAQRENMNYLMGLMVEGALPVEEFTRHVKPSSDLAHAYEELLDRRDDVLTFVLRW
jgi:threonine dehydrogenase-like Zn-dependent dehydrogenase